MPEREEARVTKRCFTSVGVPVSNDFARQTGPFIVAGAADRPPLPCRPLPSFI